MGEVLTAQGAMQRIMVTQHNDFQASMTGVFKSHNDQLVAQVAIQESMVRQMGEFQQLLEQYLPARLRLST